MEAFLAGLLLPGFPHVGSAACFTNPLRQGQDPTVVLKDGLFHLVQSDGCNIRLRRAPSIGGLASASVSTIHSPGCSELWAPELHFISNRWYIYYTLNTNLSTGGVDRRGFVAESQTTSVFGPYITRGILFHNYWNIDGSVFSWNGRLYYLFSGEPVRGSQNIFIAPMANPYTLSGPPVQISLPTESWERIGTPKVNEGPWGFEKDGRLFIVYSASGCWTDSYTLGMLMFTGLDPLSPSAWTKTGPVFTQQKGAYGPGHNSLVQDIHGQWWNVYHANNNPSEGCGNKRQIRAQRLHWNDMNLPDFGSPVPVGSYVTDSPDFLSAGYQLSETVGFAAANTACGPSGSVVGSAAWTNPGLRLAGTNNYLNAGAAVGNDVQHQLTLVAWIRPEAFEDWAGVVTKGTNSSPYAMQLWSDGSLRFTANWGNPPGGLGANSWNSIRKLKLNQWQQVAITYDGQRVRFYIDGVLDNSQPQVQLRFGVVDEPLTIGADLPGGDEYFKGSIRGVRVYGRALSANELQPKLSNLSVTDSVLTAQVSGEAGFSYQVLSSTNSVDWSVRYVTNPPSMPFGISMPRDDDPGQAFYRVRVQ